MTIKSSFFNIFSTRFFLPAATAFTITAFSVLPAFPGNVAADYMFVLKDGSNILGTVESESSLEDSSVAAVKIRTAFGEVSIPREQIAKYFKQPSKKAGETNSGTGNSETKAPAEDKQNKAKDGNGQQDSKELKKPEVLVETDTTIKSAADEKTLSKTATAEETKPPVKDNDKNIETPDIPADKTAGKQQPQKEETKPAVSNDPDPASKSQPLPEKEAGKNDIKPPVDEMSILKSEPEKVAAGDDPALVSPAKPAKDADAVLNMDDDKLIDMLGESKVEPPKNAAANEISTEGTSEIDSIKAKYQYKKGAPKELIPKNLNSLTDDVKLIAASRTEEAALLGGTKEVRVKLADTSPVEVITVGDKKSDKGESDDAKKNKKKKKGAKDKKGKEGTGEVSLGTSEVGLTTAEIMITDETEEVKKLGGGNLSENIVKQFKKHKAYPADSVEGKKHLEEEINKHFKKDEPKPAEETAEVEAGKKDKKK